MSTLVELVASGQLLRFDPELGPDTLEERQIYMLSRVPEQITSRIVGTTSDRHLEISPEEQLDALLADFCEGVELLFDEHFKCLTPHENGVWELKTPDIRIFGWFHQKDCFVVSAVDAKWRIVELNLYRPYINEAAWLRANLFGEQAPCVMGSDPDDVVSNWN